MAFNALLMCREQQALRVLGTALDEMEIEPESCLSATEAMERMAQGHYSALVLDFDLPGAAQVARLARLAPPKRRPVIFAMIDAITGIGATFQAGANFVLYKPLVPEQVERSLRAGRVFMRSDRRQASRHKLEALAYLQFGGAAMPAIVLDLNERGLSLQAAEPLPPVRELPLRFVLPGTVHMVEGHAEIIWADDEGRAGMFFTDMSPASRKYLKQWLAKRSPKKERAVRVPRVERTRISPRASH